MTEKQFEVIKSYNIDVEESYCENAVFYGDEFLCFEDDSECLVDKLNEQGKRIEHLKRKIERERRATQKQHEKWDKQATERIKELEEKNKQLMFDNAKLLLEPQVKKDEKTIKDAVIINEAFEQQNQQIYGLEEENGQLKQQVEDLYESDKSLRKFASNMTLNYTGICVPRRLFDEVLNILKDMGHNDLVEDLSKESIDTSANGC